MSGLFDGGREVVLPANAACVKTLPCRAEFPCGRLMGQAASSPMSGLVAEVRGRRRRKMALCKTATGVHRLSGPV